MLCALIGLALTLHCWVHNGIFGVHDEPWVHYMGWERNEVIVFTKVYKCNCLISLHTVGVGGGEGVEDGANGEEDEYTWN